MTWRPAAAVEPTGTDDEVLMARYRAGDADAFTELYLRYEEPLFGFCLRLLGDRHAAEDAFQETFMAVMERRPEYRPRGRFRSWVFTIARNICIDRARLRVRRARLLDAFRTLEETRGPDAGPARALDHRDDLTRVLSSLPPDQREIVLLHRYHGFSYAEIGAMTGSTGAAVKQKAYRALLVLRSKGTP